MEQVACKGDHKNISNNYSVTYWTGEKSKDGEELYWCYSCRRKVVANRPEWSRIPFKDRDGWTQEMIDRVKNCA